MIIPDAILKRVEIIEKKQRDLRIAERRAQRQEKKAADILKKLKEDRMPELIKAAEVVVGWISEFYQSPDGGRLIKAVHSINIFCASYWQGKPAPDSHMTTFATISLDDVGRVKYNERYKGNPAHETLLDVTPVNPMVLVEVLHPDYLVALAEHLRSGAVWGYVENFLKNYTY